MNFMKTADLNALRADINAALAAVAEKHGIAIATGHCQYRETGCTFKLEAAQKGEGSEGDDAGIAVIKAKAVAAWNREATFWGFPKDGLHKSIDYAGRTYRIEGLEPKSTKYPVLVSRDGKLVKLPEAAAKAGLAALAAKVPA